jgi:arginine/lysine/ornithine decarboxylase
VLLASSSVREGYLRQIINLTQTTSASYLLMAGLDISRRNLALNGAETLGRVLELAEYARREINAIGDYRAFSTELVGGGSAFDFDRTKLSVHTLEIGLAGIEVYDILRDEYDIQIEFGDIGNILSYISVGDRLRDIERLVSALGDIRRRFKRPKAGMLTQEYIPPVVVKSPQEAFYAEKLSCRWTAPWEGYAPSLPCAIRPASPYWPGRAGDAGHSGIHQIRQGPGQHSYRSRGPEA